MNQTGLCHLQIAQSGFGGISRRTNSFFGLLSSGYVRVDQDKATTWDRITAHFHHPSIRAGAFKPHFLTQIVDCAAQLSFEISGIFAALG